MPRPASFTPPAQIEEYRILRPLGQGAMGRVYLAHDTLLDRPVAIKFIAGLEPGRGPEGLSLRERFFIEARAIARLQHPNVVVVYRVGEWRGQPFLVSEFVRGDSLGRLPRPQPAARVLELAIGLCRGLAAAHRRGVLHRDIKPENAMLTREGEVKLLDFGLAKLLEPALGAAGVSQAVSLSSLLAVAPVSQPSSPSPPPSDGRAIEPRSIDPALPASQPASALVATRAARAVLAATAPARADAAPPATAPAADGGPADEALDELSDGPGAATADTLLAVAGSGSLTPSPSLTQAGDVLGSPLYMAPELWRGEPATQKADIYSLGTVLYELCAGRAPHDGLSLEELPRRAQTADAPPLCTRAPAVDPRLGAIIDRCLRREPAERFDSADALREALEQLTERAPAPRADGSPYLGLQSFEARHSGQFFGRDAEVRAALDRLRAEPLLIVTGDSGVGKSSLCKAGVLAAVEAGALGPGHRVAKLVPGRRPLWALAAALAPLLQREDAALAEALATAPHEVGRALRLQNRSPRPDGKPAGPIVLFVDQLEELLTQSEPDDQARFGHALRELCEFLPDIRVLATVRSDFLSRLSALPGLGPEVGRALFLLGPLSIEGLRESIVRPAQDAGFRFETPALVEELAQAAARTTGGLPLLQFTLSELWEARDRQRRIIPAHALETLGGLGGALARHADGVLRGMLPAERQTARAILGQLVTDSGTRTRRGRLELLPARDPAGTAALEALVRGRIVTVHAADDGESQYELAHEALLASWDTLRGWLAKDAELRAVRLRLAQAAAEWERLGRAPELLWQARQLGEAQVLTLRDLPAREAAFLGAGRRAVRRLRLRRGLLIGGAPLLLGLLFGAAQLRASWAVRRQIAEQLTQARAELATARAVNQQVEKTRTAALSAFDARRQAEGETLWDQQMALDTESRQAYRRASKAAEAAFLLGSDRADVRDTLADVLSERAAVAERNHFLGNRDELLARVWLLDPHGVYRRRWFAPAMLSVQSDPPGAAVTLVPIDEQHREHGEARRELGPAPLRDIELEPGAYLLRLGQPGRLEVRYPILAQRGEPLPLSIRLPHPSEVPPGFVYVPGGQALFGSDAEDAQRRDFFYHVPIHLVQTDPFLIAQHETTYAEWLAFLRALPADERARRRPRAGQPGISGALELRELPDGAFELTLQPTAARYTAREGEPLRFAATARRAAAGLDWSRLPVTGVSSEDAQAYVSWLSASGRVPGARLCTEREWEHAARGPDDRHYPHGDRLLPADANFDQTYGQEPAAMGPDEVGAHPASRSFFGIDDLAGNAFEWVTGGVSEKPYALRGGAYYYGSRTCRIDNRYEAEPTMRNPTVGVRVCATMRRP